jgi:lipopolysaccharide transport system permease protein
MFASPVIYPSSLIPQKWKLFLALNPMTGIIEGFRASLFGGDLDWTLIAVATVLTTILLPGAALIFRRVEDSFADII